LSFGQEKDRKYGGEKEGNVRIKMEFKTEIKILLISSVETGLTREKTLQEKEQTHNGVLW
jgi:hypothetical protein